MWVRTLHRAINSSQWHLARATYRIKEHHQRFAVTLLRADGSVVGEGAGEVGGGSLSFSFGIVTPSSPEVVHRIPGG